MEPHVIVLDAARDQTFLKQQRRDPVIKDLLKAGDRVVVCAHCQLVFLEDTWEAVKGRVFGHRTRTMTTLPPTDLTPIHFGRRVQPTAPPAIVDAQVIAERENIHGPAPNGNGAPTWSPLPVEEETVTLPTFDAAMAAEQVQFVPAAYTTATPLEDHTNTETASDADEYTYVPVDNEPRGAAEVPPAIYDQPVTEPEIVVPASLRLREIPFKLREIPFALREVRWY